MSAQPNLTASDAAAIGRLDAHDQADLVRRREATPLDLVEAAIRRIEARDPAINSVSWKAYDLARARAAQPPVGGPLAGVPYLVKDSLAYPGMPSFAGSRSRSDEPATEAYPYIRAFDAEGLIPVGKSTMPEFGLMPVTESLRFGATRSPWALDRTAGGSSGGAAAAVAAGLVPLAHASDAGGSIRLPAACCGLPGLKPSRGANVRARSMHWLDDLFCGDSMIARSMRDLAWAFAAARPGGGPAVTGPGRERLSIGVMMEGLNGRAPHPEVANAVAAAAALCAGLGHRVTPIARPAEEIGLIDVFLYDLWPFAAYDVAQTVAAANPGTPLDRLLDPWAIGLAEACARLGPDNVERGLDAIATARASQQALFERFDVVLSPTLSELPAKIGRFASDRPFADMAPDMADYMAYTQVQNMAGSPAISLPLAWTSDDMPIGVMFAAGRGQDDRLLGLAFELEEAAPWCDRWPDVTAKG